MEVDAEELEGNRGMGRGGGRWCGDDATPATRAAQVRGRGGGFETGGEVCGRLGVAELVEGDGMLVLAVITVEVGVVLVVVAGASLDGFEGCVVTAMAVGEATEGGEVDGCDGGCEEEEGGSGEGLGTFGGDGGGVVLDARDRRSGGLLVLSELRSEAR